MSGKFFSRFVVILSALVTLDVYADALPAPKKPTFGCSASLASNPADLAKALWCLQNRTEQSDPKFWAQAKQHMPNVLTKYDNSGAYLDKLGVVVGEVVDASSDQPLLPKFLPEAKKPGVLGCKAGLATDLHKLPEALWCLEHTTAASDPNFWAKAREHMPNVLKDYDDVDAYLKVLGVVIGDGSDGNSNNMPLLSMPKAPTFGCSASLVASEAAVMKNMPQVMFCAEKNTKAISDGASLFPDPNFMALALNIVPEVLQKYSGGVEYLQKLGWRNAGDKKVLPTVKSPKLGCRASLVADEKKTKANLPEAMFCFDKNAAQLKAGQEFSDPNFMEKATKSLPIVLEGYQGGDEWLAATGFNTSGG